MARDHGPEPDRKGASCPICGAAAAPRWRPFCSRRCADVDLGRWLTGAYAVPSDEDVPGDPSESEQ